jgi:hypothetical protein
MNKDETIKYLIKQNDFILNTNRSLKLKIFIKNILLSGSVLLNVFFFYRIKFFNKK